MTTPWPARGGRGWAIPVALALASALPIAMAGAPGPDVQVAGASISLRIETGAHVAPIRGIATDRAGRYAVTAAEDKTARIWDIASGRLLQVFRPPSAPGNDGKLFAVSMLPEGDLFAVGGWSADNDVYLVRRADAEPVHRITGLPNVVTALAFSPDGRVLAIGLWGNGGLRVFGTSDQWRSIRELNGDGDIGADVHALAWSPDGRRLAASAADGAVRLYEVAPDGLGRPLRAPPDGRTLPFGLAFSPDGRELAVGAANRPVVTVLDGSNLQGRSVIKPAGGDTAAGLNALAWAPDGQRLLAAGTWRVEDRKFPGCIWQRGKPDCSESGTIAGNTVTGLAPLPDGRTLFASADAAWGVLDGGGRRVLVKDSVLRDFRELRRHFRLASDGSGVALHAPSAGEGADAFDLRSLAWTRARLKWAAPQTRIGRTMVEDWFEQHQPTINRRPVRLEDNELSLTVAVAPKGDQVAMGTNFFLRLYDASGRELWHMPVPGSTWQVNLSADGRWVVAAFSDGTVRWYRTGDGAEQVALLAHSDGRRWVAWTPGGYFAASAGAEELAGWQMDRGKERGAAFYPVSRFRAEFYRPELIQEVVALGGEAAALQAVSATTGRPPAAMPVAQQLPPSVRILSPDDGSASAGQVARVRIQVESPPDAPPLRLRSRVNGAIVPLPDMASLVRTPGADHGEVLELPIALPAADADVMVFAENRHGTSSPAVVRILHPAVAKERPAPAAEASQPRPPSRPDGSPGGLPGDQRPALYVLAIGVSEYADPKIRLDYSAKDATDLAHTLKSQEGGLYRKVAVRLLTDRAAARDSVLDGLEWIRREITSRDVGVVFLAGHGVNDSDGVYYFLPHDTEVKRLKRTGVIFTEIRNTLVSLPGKALFFVDTCHSGNVLGTGLRALPNDTTAIVNELSSAENGVIVFAATTGRQYAQESEAWGNGAFTKALLEGLTGKADMTHSGRVTHKMLDLYVSERVKGLTEGAQSPVTIVPNGVPDFPLALSSASGVSK